MPHSLNPNRGLDAVTRSIEFGEKPFIPTLDEPWRYDNYYMDFTGAPSSVMLDMEGQAIGFPMKYEDSFDDTTPGMNLRNSTNSNGGDLHLMAYQDHYAAYDLSVTNPGFPKSILFDKSPWFLRDEGWSSMSSFRDQSDCGQSPSSLASFDQPSRAGKYLNGDMSSYTKMNSPRSISRDACQEHEFVDMRMSFLDPRLATNVQLTDGRGFPQMNRKGPLQIVEELPDRADLPDIVIGGSEVDSDCAIGDRYKDPKAGLRISVAVRKSFQTLSTQHRPSLEPQQEYCRIKDLPQVIHSRNRAVQRLTPQDEDRKSAERTKEDTAQRPGARSNNRGIGGLNTIRYITPRRKTEDCFLVTSRRAGMSYKEIRQKGGLQAAESTLRGRFRALTKARKDRVRKPVWTERDIRLLKEAVKIDLRELESTKACRGMDRSAKISKVSWKSISEYIAAKGGSYQFGNATCKKKWNEIHDTA